MGHEKTQTFSSRNKKGETRHFVVPSVSARTGKPLKDPFRTARAQGLLGRGFKTLKEAEASGRKRSKSFDEPRTARGQDITKAASRPGGRVRRREKLQGSRRPFNPGGRSRGK